VAGRDLSRQTTDVTSHLVIILRWKLGLNCVKRWLNTYYRMAGWYISTHWPSGMVTAPDKLPWSRQAEICGWPRSQPADGRLDISFGHHPKMKARAKMCQKVIKYILEDGRMIYKHSLTFWHGHFTWEVAMISAGRDLWLAENWPADLTSHLVIILRWKQGLNCVKRWLSTYYRMAGWYISTHWPSGMVTAPDKLPWSRQE